MNVKKRRKFVHVVSHGPHCLDGLTAAVAVARYHRGTSVQAHFCSHTNINDVLRDVRCEPQEAEHEIWITDISWTDPAVDRHLRNLVKRGVKVYWIDHHRSALERYRAGEIGGGLTDHVLSEEYAAARLTYDYLRRRLTPGNDSNEWFAALAPLVAMADDNDRWLHRIPGSRRLALTVAAMSGLEAYHELLLIDADMQYTARMREAAERAEGELRRSFAAAERNRVVRRCAPGTLTLVAALCDGYPSEIADAWSKTFPNAVFALFDTRSVTVSLRRSPDCEVDLSQVARRLGGGGHAAAAGCELPELQVLLTTAMADFVASVLEQAG